MRWIPHSSPEAPGWGMATSPGTQIDASFPREGSSLWTHFSAGREAFFHGHGGETLPEDGAVQSASWPFMGGFAKTAVLWRQEGQPSSVPTPGPVGDPGIQRTPRTSSPASLPFPEESPQQCLCEQESYENSPVSRVGRAQQLPKVSSPCGMQ